MKRHLAKHALVATGAVFALSAFGGEFAVSPVRVDLGAGARSGALIVRNEGKEKLGFQMQLMEWRQDASGKDEYVDTQALVFFPKLMSVEPEKEGLIRVGVRSPAGDTERTYRLFINELPGAKRPEEQKGAQVNFLIRFGAPIFVAPLQPRDELAVETFGLSKGTVALTARNSGNRHQVIQGVHLTGLDSAGTEVFTTTLADRYLLAGSVKSFSASVPPAQCARMVSLAVEVRTDKLTSARKLDVLPAMCS